MKQSYNGTPVPADGEAIEYSLPLSLPVSEQAGPFVPLGEQARQSGVEPPHSIGKTPPFAGGAQGKQDGAPAEAYNDAALKKAASSRRTP
ncbi:MAG: hypothetical protein ACRD4H_12225 [Candidatus Acidiferrales bacterium]